MATLEQRLQAVEQAIANSKITPNLPSLNTLVGDELLPVWSNSLQNTVQYPLGNLVGGGGASAINDVIPVFKIIYGIDYESATAINSQIASIINADTAFAKTQNQLLILYTVRITVEASIFNKNLAREYYLFTGTKGNYGSGATQISSQDIVYFVTDKDDSRENAIFDLGEIGDTSPIQDEVNTSGPYDPSVAQLIVFKAQRSGIEFDFLYVGQTISEIGSNETQTTLDDFVNLNTATPDAPPEGSVLDTELDINSNNAVTNSAITQAINNITSNGSARGTGISSSFTVSAANGGTVFTLSSLKFEISSDEGYLANNPSQKLNITVENLNANSTFVYYNKDGDLAQQTTYPTIVDFVRKAFVARIVIDVNVNEIVGFEYFYNPLGQYSNLIRTVIDYVKEAGVPLKKGLTVTGKNNSLGFGIGAGSLLRFGGTGNSLEPSTPSFADNPNVSFVLADRNSADSGGNTLIPKFWDNNGVITALGSTTVSGARVYFFNSGVIGLQYGQGNYANMTLAKAGVKLEEYVVNPLATNATFLGWWLIESTATRSAGTENAQFVEYTIGVQGGSSSSLSGAFLIGNNFSEILNAAAARSNLGIPNNFVNKTGNVNEDITGSKNFKNRAIFNDNTWIEDTGSGVTIISQNANVPVNMIFRPNGRASAVGQMVLYESGRLEIDGKIQSTTFEGDGSELDNVDALTLNGSSASDFQLKSEKGSANGYASLVGGKVPVNQLPSYVDDVLEFASLSGFPNAGETGKIYIALDTNKQYRWTGSNYLQITNGLIASTNDLPEGSNNLYFTVARVLATLLTSFTPFGSSSNLVATDSIFTALRKLQFRVALNDAKVVITNFISRTGNVDESINGEKTFSNKTLVPSNSGVKGSGFGSSNFSIFSFYGSDGTTRQGYIGFGSTNDSDYFLVNDVSGKRLVLKENGDFDYNGDVIVDGNIKSRNTLIRDNTTGATVISQNAGSGESIIFRPKGDANASGEVEIDEFGNLKADNVITNVKTKTSATSYLFQDSNKTVAPLFTSGSSVSAVVKLGTPIGTKFVLSQFGTGTVTITGESGVTLRFPSGELAVPASRYSFVELEVVDTNEVAVIGRLKQA